VRNDKRSVSIRTDRADPLYQVIGHAMAKLRTVRGMSQRDVGDVLGLDNATICMYESGRNRVSLGTFVRWCEALDAVPGVVLEEAREQAERLVPRQQNSSD
jgi:transcriptional regulator with XRE-family HTH domain